jgi:hypothetical protein
MYEEGDDSVVTVIDLVEKLGVFKEDSMVREVVLVTRTRLQCVITCLK